MYKGSKQATLINLKKNKLGFYLKENLTAFLFVLKYGFTNGYSFYCQ